MRTEKDHINLSGIASKFGGGGHKKAAAFKTGISKINIVFDHDGTEDTISGTR